MRSEGMVISSENLYATSMSPTSYGRREVTHYPVNCLTVRAQKYNDRSVGKFLVSINDLSLGGKHSNVEFP